MFESCWIRLKPEHTRSKLDWHVEPHLVFVFEVNGTARLWPVPQQKSLQERAKRLAALSYELVEESAKADNVRHESRVWGLFAAVVVIVDLDIIFWDQELQFGKMIWKPSSSRTLSWPEMAMKMRKASMEMRPWLRTSPFWLVQQQASSSVFATDSSGSVYIIWLHVDLFHYKTMEPWNEWI